LKKCFNPRSRGGSDQGCRGPILQIPGFNPRSRGGSDVCCVSCVVGCACFNPRSRGGSDQRATKAHKLYHVSIHAPAGGATGAPDRCVVQCLVSIHAPAGGATNWPSFHRQVHLFQSTLPRGERHRPVNPHLSFGGFNPRSRGGSDGRTPAIWHRLMFQSTLPRGERPHVRTVVIPIPVSIHAPAGGATALQSQLLNSFAFQSTLPRGERRRRSGRGNGRRKFQSTLPRGERLQS